MAPSSSSPAYAKDEKVLCFHHELLYEAKVLDSKVKDPNDKKDGYMYKVHYKGWKNTWDDWAPQERLRKLTEENKELASNLKKDMEAQRRAATSKPSITSHKKRPYGSELTGSSARGSEERSSAVPQAPRGTKRGREIEGIDKPKQEEDFVRRPAVRLFIPDSLKSILVDDWEKVTKEQKLATVPSPTPVTQFLNEYYESEANNRRPGSADADILEEVIAGVKEYFNKSLGRILLYRFERHQFYEVHKQIESGHGEHTGKTLCDMYGCEHLLRLFVSMPDLIAHTNMDSQSVSRLREELSKMTQWLAKRIPKYLSTEYEHAGQEYLDSSKNGA
ncbi:Esa1p-associated factor [Vermiconidia calcicola]|uniref:Esa1p-associated factor n=1 Tax=Vermiconidia calcicola TaxID=1690605 RepID=A0ACC3N3P8_9PEZI|nr:Esa1p-associated factor [Vermiconidia calcicola]